MEELAEIIRNPATKLQEWDQPNTYSACAIHILLNIDKHNYHLCLFSETFSLVLRIIVGP